jgi:hypothetical protein
MRVDIADLLRTHHPVGIAETVAQDGEDGGGWDVDGDAIHGHGNCTARSRRLPHA